MSVVGAQIRASFTDFSISAELVNFYCPILSGDQLRARRDMVSILKPRYLFLRIQFAARIKFIYGEELLLLYGLLPDEPSDLYGCAEKSGARVISKT